MNLLFFTQHFPPEQCADSARLIAFTRFWKKMGHDVQVVCPFPNYPNGIIPNEYKGLRYKEENYDGVTVHRVWVYATANRGFWRKLFMQLSYIFTSVFALKHIHHYDVVLATSPAFFTLLIGHRYAKRGKAPLVLDIRDLYPRVAVEMGVMKNKWVIKVFESIERKLYRDASLIALVTNGAKKDLISRGVSEEKLCVMTNGFDPDLFTMQPYDSALAAKLNITGKFVIQYIGTHGLAQSLGTVIEAADILKQHTDIVFLLIGEGADKPNILQMTKSKGLQNIIFLDHQPKAELSHFYSIADISIVILRDLPMFAETIPSKVFELLGSGVPILGAVRGECAEILERSGGASIIQQENSQMMAQQIIQLKNNPQQLQKMREAGPDFVRNNYLRDSISERYLHELCKRFDAGQQRP
jgi:glycosyltransferase involved in cell wall biosynthesis